MKNSTLTHFLAGTAILATASFQVQAVNIPAQERVHRMYSHQQSTNSFSSDRQARIEAGNRMVLGSSARYAASESDQKFSPTTTVGPTSILADLDGPDGQTWFYSMHLDYEDIKHEYFIEQILRSYTVSIYDETHTLVGTIKDDMHYADDEVRVPTSGGCDILPVITKHFFNTDDAYEIAIGLAVNSTTPGINHYRTVIYQLNGDKDENGNDKIVLTLNGFIADVLDASTPGQERYFMSQASESFTGEYPADKEGKPEVWDFYMAQKAILHVYKGAEDATGPVKILSYEMPIQCLPGDQESTPYLITTMHDGKPYAVFSRYEESFFNPYYSYSDDLSQRENNNLVIDIYSLDGTPVQTQHTVVPAPKDPTGNYGGSFYGIGDFLYRGDIDFDHYGTPEGQAAFIISNKLRTSLASESSLASYYVVNPDGSTRATLFKEAAMFNPLTDVKGQEPQILFVSPGTNGYDYTFVDLYSGKTRASFPYYLVVEDSDPDRMTTNLDRAAYGDSYRYAVEMAVPSEEDDIVYLRVAWLDETGKFIKMDEVNIGSNVYYPQCFINGVALDPNLFHSDETMEYMILIKRGLDDGSIVEELNISQVRTPEYPDGRVLLDLGPEERGALGTINLYAFTAQPMLAVYYVKGGSYIVDYYNLPLDSSDGVTDIIGDAAQGGTFAPGDSVEVFNMQGMRIAGGTAATAIDALAAGVYIIKSETAVKKVIKK
ncbi:MAG: hypothetical protein NC405_06950 [Odoribacter sp.]|nr:hypothetical protein [Odoribacter sp.]